MMQKKEEEIKVVEVNENQEYKYNSEIQEYKQKIEKLKRKDEKMMKLIAAIID